MPAVFAAVVPHTPLLVPAIAKQHQRLFAPTRQVLLEVMQEMYASQPDCLLVLTPHGLNLGQAFSGQVADTLTGGLEEFGDVATWLSVSGAPYEAHRLKEISQDMGVPFMLQTAPGLDYGTVVPLTLWPSGAPCPRILPISLSGQTESLAIRLGLALERLWHSSTKRWAVMASADFTRRPPSAPPADRRPSPEERAASEAIGRMDPSRLLGAPWSDKTCGRLPVTALITALHKLSRRGTIRSFEAPLNAGLLVATSYLDT